MRRLSSMVLRPGAGAPVFLFAGAGGDGDELDGLADALAARLPAGAAIVSLAAAAGPEDSRRALANMPRVPPMAVAALRMPRISGSRR